MLRYTLFRILGAIPTLLLVIALAFMMVRAAPGGPFDAEYIPSTEVEKNLRDAYGLDDPLPQQFLTYLSGLLRGDLGPSIRQTGYSVAELIGEALPYSFLLGATAMLLALLLGVGAGTVAALRQGSLLDRTITGLSLTGISIPVFVVAPVLVLLFAVKLQWLPAGWGSARGAATWVLPVVTLALPQLAYVARLMRASMIDVLSSDFVRTARAQGLGTATIVRVHALKPAMLPVISYLGPAVAGILTGSVVVEEVFGIPGLGEMFVRAALNRDYTLVLGVVVFYASLIVALNLVVDILYGVIDPRVRYR
ncbi:MAG: ABC transporter permease [Gammaproteobacteria bacterium]|nr:ABC transporter permease [Gammaproteobacteria bacterium]NNF50361.1 ABC transporter permease [Woeseiaceae bacterium]MBT8094784.1 ABC transporter permease [Gammaproteobacteria bacterium]MBT8104055.1 ABC transporter permease [Gammaproteobacteria bacterium]NNK24070.1 ABC transporter permease [Woeseiaceae bacterium]